MALVVDRKHETPITEPIVDVGVLQLLPLPESVDTRSHI